MIDIRTLGLVVALALLAVGLYRLYEDLRASKSRRSKSRPGPGQSADPRTSQPPQRTGGAPADAAARGSDPGVKPRAPEPAPTPAASDPGAKARPPAEAKPAPPSTPAPARMVPALQEHDPDEDITIITLAPPPDVVAALNALKATPNAAAAFAAPAAPTPADLVAPAKIDLHPDDEEDDEDSKPGPVPIVYDADASVDEVTQVSPLILVSAAAQTDQGRRRRRNEDSLLVLEEHHLFVVADGMGGHAGGDVASKMAVETIGDAFKKESFGDEPFPDVPRRGAELAVAIQMANKAIYEHAKANAAYTGMGTTVVSARFSPNKQRVYFGHVGDSRCYRLRAKQLTQVTTDHTMASQGVTGPLASHLNRAVGVQPAVKVDLLIARPRPDDVYLLCTDGLSKMVPDDQIQAIMNEEPDLEKAVHKLVDRANARGGRDNITVILVQVKDPKGLAKYIQEHGARNPAPAN